MLSSGQPKMEAELDRDLSELRNWLRSLGRNHRSGNPDRSSSRSASLGAKFVRPALSDAHVLSTLLPEAVAGLTRSSQAQPPTSSKSLPDKNAASVRSI